MVNKSEARLPYYCINSKKVFFVANIRKRTLDPIYQQQTFNLIFANFRFWEIKQNGFHEQ